MSFNIIQDRNKKIINISSLREHIKTGKTISVFRDKFGNSLLMRSILNKKQITKGKLCTMLKECSINLKNNDGDTALILAIRSEIRGVYSIQTVELLLEKEQIQK